jgi:hypothetical protein
MPKAGITLTLIRTKKTNKNIITSIMGMISMRAFFLCVCCQWRMMLNRNVSKRQA